jgi:hypothetical protein
MPAPLLRAADLRQVTGKVLGYQVARRPVRDACQSVCSRDKQGETGSKCWMRVVSHGIPSPCVEAGLGQNGTAVAIEASMAVSGG